MRYRSRITCSPKLSVWFRFPAREVVPVRSRVILSGVGRPSSVAEKAFTFVLGAKVPKIPCRSLVVTSTVSVSATSSRADAPTR